MQTATCAPGCTRTAEVMRTPLRSARRAGPADRCSAATQRDVRHAAAARPLAEATPTSGTPVAIERTASTSRRTALLASGALLASLQLCKPS
jgi:hypothetical protein